MGTFFAELKRRNVFKVGIAYGIVAWLLIQIVVTVFPVLTLPDWSSRLVTIIILLGFPLALILAWAYELTPEGIKATSSVTSEQGITQSTGQRFNYIILGLVVLAVVFMLVDNYVLKDTTTSTVSVVTTMPDETKHATTAPSVITSPVSASAQGPTRRSSLILGPTRRLATTNLSALVALSPDGLQLVYAVNTEQGVQLQHLNLNQLSTQALPVPTRRSIYDVFFSPDGEWVGVSAGTPGSMALYKIPLQGGPPQLLAEGFNVLFGGHWTRDSSIYISAWVDTFKIYRVPDTGGTLEPIAVAGASAKDSHTWPYPLPDGTHLLVTISPFLQARDGRIVLLDLTTGQTRNLIQNGYHARYVPTGHIVFMRAESLWAVPFDVSRMQVTGPEVPVINGVHTGSVAGEAAYAFSDDGLLVYLPGGDVGAGGSDAGGTSNQQLVWVERDGTETLLPAKVQDYRYPHLSPDGTQVAVTIRNQGGRDIWTYDLARSILSRRTFSGNAQAPLWSPDGTRLVYGFYPNLQGLAWVRADGTGQPEPLIEAPRLLLPTAFTPDGSQLIFFETATGPNDIYTLSLTGERTEQPLLATEFTEARATLSPDGFWLAYNSDETGQQEIYVRPYPNLNAGKWQVSTDGGVEPHWRGDGKELFYWQPGNPVTMLAVPVETGQSFQAGTPVELFRENYFITSLSSISYDVTADGQRFLFCKTAEGAGADETVEFRETNLVMVENWFAELKRLAPPVNK